MEADKTTTVKVSGPPRDPKDLMRMSAGDAALALTNAGLQLIPFVGSAVSALVQMAIQTPLQNRVTAFITELDSEVRAQSDKLGCLPDQLYESAIYSSALISCTHIALLTQEPAKIDALKAAMLNVALDATPDEAVNQMRIAALRDMTSVHIKLLRLYIQHTDEKAPYGPAREGKTLADLLPFHFREARRATFEEGPGDAYLDRACCELESSGLIEPTDEVAPIYRLSATSDMDPKRRTTNYNEMRPTEFGRELADFISRKS
ncbi:hypothetical protein [Stenotrophomonas sp. Iso1]|uniref:hypothetical protein n=1 Tax=Stenotrophomonas sp. Iso1 TaxID=2977283 RepID=UPI0022B76E70|nr:hypothetical protein [Stenotrophomonas sp. Iso1]